MVAGRIWGVILPINKNLWTSSFTLFTAGIAAQLLAICHFVLDVKHARAWALPAVAIGRNALVGYFLSVALDSVLTRWSVGTSSMKWTIFEDGFAAHMSSMEAASLAYAASYVLLWATILWAMYRRRIFIGI